MMRTCAHALAAGLCEPTVCHTLIELAHRAQEQAHGFPVRVLNRQAQLLLAHRAGAPTAFKSAVPHKCKMNKKSSRRASESRGAINDTRGGTQGTWSEVITIGSPSSSV